MEMTVVLLRTCRPDGTSYNRFRWPLTVGATVEAPTVMLRWWDGTRSRLTVGYIGEDGLLPETPYRLDELHRFVRADAVTER